MNKLFKLDRNFTKGIPSLKFIECDATTIDSAKSQQLVVGVFYFLTWHDMDVRRHAFFALELLTLNEKKLSLVSSGESLVLIHELSNLNHPILIINHSVPWLNLTSLGKQSPFPYFMTFDWLQILSRNLNITGKTVQQHKSRRIRLILTGSTWIPTQSPTFILRRNSEISIQAQRVSSVISLKGFIWTDVSSSLF